MDCMNNVTKLNTMIRDCTHELLGNLKKLEASELYQCSKSGNCNKSKCCGGGGHSKGTKTLRCHECEIKLNPYDDRIMYDSDKNPYCEDCFYELFGSSGSLLIRSVRSEDGSGDYSDSG